MPKEDPFPIIIGVMIFAGLIFTFIGLNSGLREQGFYLLVVAGSILFGSAGIMGVIRQLKDEIVGQT